MSDSDMYQELADRLMMGHSDRIKKIFSMVADEDEAKLLLAMPALPEDLADSSGRPLDEIKDALDVMFKKGLVFISASSGKYRMCRDIVQFHDATILWKEAPQEFLDVWKEWTKQEWKQTAKIAESMMPTAPTRIVPVEAALEEKNQILHYENVKEIIEKARVIAVTPCTCRVADGACGQPVEVCLQLNRAADYAIKRETGREIDKAEAMDILRKSEEAGLVHVTMNTDSIDHYICNCCHDCCIGLQVIRSDEGSKFVAPSRFQAYVDEDDCVGCESCLERCYFDALSMEDDKAVVNSDKCVGCGLCAVVCPSEAIHFNEAHPADFIPTSGT
jgi:ferredoxin